MKPNKYDNEYWYVQLVHNKVEIHTIPKSQKSVYKQDYIFYTYEEAEQCKNNLHKMYFETFQRKPYVRVEKLVPYYSKLVEIEISIIEQLSDYPNFDGIDFCDVCASGIQIRGHHKLVRGYCFGSQPTIEYDFSNYKDCITEFVEMWKSKDNKKVLEQYNSFLEAGDRWGWD